MEMDRSWGNSSDQTSAPMLECDVSGMCDEMANVYRNLAQGWNTWNSHSLTSHILLPQCLEVNIGFIDQYNANYVCDFSNKHRPMYGEHGVRGEYTDITLEVHRKPFRVETAAIHTELLIKITPSNQMQGTEFFSVTAGGIWGGNFSICARDDTLIASDGANQYLLEALTETTQPKWDPTRGPHLTFASDKPIYLRLNSHRSDAAIDKALVEAKADFLANTISSEGDLEHGLSAMRRVLLWNTILDSETGRVVTPVNRSWTRYGSHFGHHVLFGWDTFLGALMLGMIDKNLAYANLYAMLGKATPDGMVPNWGGAGGQVSLGRSQPQVGSWCAYKLYLQFGDKWFLEACYDKLLAWNEWRFRERDANGDGLLELGSSFPKELPPGVTEQFAADQKRTPLRTRIMWESGLDNSPMWDRAKIDPKSDAMNLSYVGLNALMVADCQVLAGIARVLGKTNDQKKLSRRGDALWQRIENNLWHERKGCYLNRFWNGKFDATMSLTHFYTMLSGDVPENRLNRMLNKHLLNPKEFWTRFVAPNVPRSEPSYKEQAYWRGRVWGPTNFLVTEGCRRSGRNDIASRIAAKSLKLLLIPWRERGAVCENFNANAGKGRGDNWNEPFYTWGGLLAYICIQEFFDAQVWSDEVKLGSTRKPPAKMLRNIPFRDKKLTISAEGKTAIKTSDGTVIFTHKGAVRLDPDELTKLLG